jgi:hypothetical protein
VPEAEAKSLDDSRRLPSIGAEVHPFSAGLLAATGVLVLEAGIAHVASPARLAALVSEHGFRMPARRVVSVIFAGTELVAGAVALVVVLWDFTGAVDDAWLTIASLVLAIPLVVINAYLALLHRRSSSVKDCGCSPINRPSVGQGAHDVRALRARAAMLLGAGLLAVLTSRSSLPDGRGPASLILTVAVSVYCIGRFFPTSISLGDTRKGIV